MTCSLLPPRRFAILCTWWLAAFAGLSGAAPAANVSREVMALDLDWRFHPGDLTNAIAPDYDDHEWRRVEVPHDYVVEGVFSARNS